MVFTLLLTWDGVLFSLSITSKMPPKNPTIQMVQRTHICWQPLSLWFLLSPLLCRIALSDFTNSDLRVKAPRASSQRYSTPYGFSFSKPCLNPQFPQSISCSSVLVLSLSSFFYLGLFSLLSIVSGWSRLAPWFSSDLSAFASCVCLSTILLSTQDFCLSAGHQHVLMRAWSHSEENWTHFLPHKTFYFLISVNIRSFCHTSKKMAPVSDWSSLPF